MATHPAELAHEEVQLQMKALASRDLQLWAIGFLVLLVLATAFVALVMPNLVWRSETLRVEFRYLPQLAFGFIALTVLFNLYLFEQRRELNNTREALLRQLMVRERPDSQPLVDPLTQVFSRRFLDHLLPREVERTRRLGTSLAFLLVHLLGGKAVNTRFGNLAGDQYLLEAAQLLERTFRGADLVVRYDDDQFLVVMPETNEEQAAHAVEQLGVQINAWNASSTRGYKMAVACGQACYTEGADIASVLRSAEESVRLQLRESEGVLGGMCPTWMFLGCGDDVIRALRPILDSLGVAVEICPQVDAGLEVLSRQKIDGVVVDCDDQENSSDLLKRMRALPSVRGAILLTVVGNGVAPDVGSREGANFVLTKPVSAEMAAKVLRVAYGLMIAERRRYFRYAVDLPVTIGFAGEPPLQASVTNLSEGGMAVHTSRILEAGRVASLHFALPGAKKPVEVKGEVGWADVEGRVGFRFLSMSEPDRRRMQQWLLDKLEQETQPSAASTGATRQPAPAVRNQNQRAAR